jgi:hypothetical protein
MPHIFLLVRNACPTRKRLFGAAPNQRLRGWLVPLSPRQAIRRDMGRDMGRETGREMGLKSAVKTGC